MKRFALFLGGLLVLPAFGEVAPIYYDDMVEYSDMLGDESEYEFYDEEVATESHDSAASTAKQPAVKISRQPTTSRNIANRTTASRGTPSSASSANTSARGNSTGNSSRAVAARTTTNSSRAVATRGNSSRAVTSRTTSNTSTAGATRAITDAVASSRAAATRATGGASRGTATRTGTAATKSTTARTATTAATSTAANRAATSRAARTQVTTLNTTKLLQTDQILQDDTVNKTLYNGFDSGRVSVRSNTVMNNRVPTIRMASMSGTTSTSEVSVSAADLAAMDELAELTDYCKAQYMACMDNYCNVLDDNQGRCSCSANLKNYAKTEEALKKATEELQEVAQKIQYIGLTAREVESLFTQTEAELQMEKTSDNSQLKTSLDKIKDMIIDAKSNPSSYSSTSSGLSFDLSGLLDFTIDSTGFDINSFLGGFLNNGSDVKNQRGAELYKTATARCKSNVLKACTAQGVDASIITNAYDLEIDRECLAYERDLNDSNDRMSATVRNAKSVLQKARLLVAQAKNEYDMLGCVNALDSCMQDEFVCGSDYENCLDPSGRYIVNGEIVIGTDPGRAINGVDDEPAGITGVLNGDICSMNLYNVWNYGNSVAGRTEPSQGNCTNAWHSQSLIDPAGYDEQKGNLKDYIDQTIFKDVSDANAGTKSIGMSQFLQNKIGWVTKDSQNGTRNYGMCISILNKCQDYTYDRKGSSTEYKFDNEVIKQYLYRVMVQIKAKQDQILSDYAESCISDVNTCLSQNNYPASLENGDWDATQANIAVNACRSTIVTCMSVNGYSVNNPTPSDLSRWVCGLKFNDPTCTGEDETQTEKYTVNFDCWNEIGGSGSVASITQSSPGADIKLPDYGCTMSGSTQTGWKLPGIMGGEIKHAGDRIKPTSNVTVDAYWSSIAYAVTLNANGGIGGNKTLYFADNQWWRDSGKTQQVSSVPTDMRPSRSGYTLRGYTNTKQTPDISAQNQTNNVPLGNELVINKNYGFTGLGPYNTIYAAWAQNCEDSAHCELQISEDTGYVEYKKLGSCPNDAWANEYAYNMTCASQADVLYYKLSLDKNCDWGSCTNPSPSTIYYVYDKKQSSYTDGHWYENEPNASNTNPSADDITSTGITVPTTQSGFPFNGFYGLCDEGQAPQQIIKANGSFNQTLGCSTTLYGNWDRQKFTYTCGNSCGGTGGTEYYASGTSVAATAKCGTNAKWTRCGDAYYANGGAATCAVGTSDMTASASCSGTTNYPGGEVDISF